MYSFIRYFLLLSFILILPTKELNAQNYLDKRSVYHDSIFISAYYVFSLDQKKIQQERDKYESLSPQKKFRLNYCIGLREMQKGKWEHFEHHFNKCLALNKQHHQRNQELALIPYYFYLSAQFQTKPHQIQLKFLFQADSLIMTDFDSEHFGSIRQAIIETYRIQGKLDLSENWIDDTRKVYAKKKEPESELIWLVSASVYTQQGNRTKNKQYYYKALGLLQRFQNNHFRFERPFYRTRIYTEMGACYSGLNNSEKAIAYFEKAIQLNKEMGDRDATILQKINLLNEEGKLKHHRKVISMGIELLKDSSNVELKNRISEVYLNMGKSYVAIGDYKTANSYYQKHLYSEEQLLKSEYSNQLEELETRYKTTQKEVEIARISSLRKQELNQ
ncbi:MAG: tetratricopeptide repeat protein, partial [Bacteroidetes bacterium]|nr:tetratricopeptide repeat protein [Bacteroidota bacterium]